MSVRRLAEPALQPTGFAFAGENVAAASNWIAKYPKGREQSAVIPLMMLAQDQEGWVTKAAIEKIADMLGMPYIRALEVATFYTQFQLNPVGTKAHIQVCGTTPCMLRGAEGLIKICQSKIHHDAFHTNASGTLSWEEVECAGACVNAPMVTIFKDTYEDLTPERLAEIIDQFEAGQGASVPVGPQIDRVVSAPMSGLTSLTDEKTILKSTRDTDAKARAEAAANAPAEAEVPPSNAAKPQTAAIETSPAVKSPSELKVAPAAEAAASVAPPAHSAANANKASEEVEKTDKQRSSGTSAAGGKPSLEDPNRPEGIEKPAVVDDLKLITGIGPKNEGVLHSLGIYTFAQVAAWTEAERHWVDGYLNFRGRIERENWVRQADALARGGVEEYVRVFGRKPQ